MRLLRVHVIAADTYGGLLDGLDLWLRSPFGHDETFEPLCLIGPNGTGKSQFLQVLAEIFQAVFHAAVPEEERIESNPALQFEVEYLIRPHGTDSDVHVRLARVAEGRRKPAVVIQQKVDGAWVRCDLTDRTTLALLPSKVVGYTSGNNGTLSLPFLLSRSGYADEVGRRALAAKGDQTGVPDTRLLWIDYGTHLAVLVANLLLGSNAQRAALLQDAGLRDMHSFRCIVQLAHSAAPKAPARRKSASTRKGIQLTQELEDYLDRLRRCATCYYYEEKTETYTFDFFVDDQSRVAFSTFWGSAFELYSTFHKLSMLNDLALPKVTRQRFRKDVAARRFASRLPEPQDEEKVFRFERVNFFGRGDGGIVDYVSLSDGEHQLAQLLGMLCMVSFPNVLFL